MNKSNQELCQDITELKETVEALRWKLNFVKQTATTEYTAIHHVQSSSRSSDWFGAVLSAYEAFEEIISVIEDKPMDNT